MSKQTEVLLVFLGRNNRRCCATAIGCASGPFIWSRGLNYAASLKAKTVASSLVFGSGGFVVAAKLRLAAGYRLDCPFNYCSAF